MSGGNSRGGGSGFCGLLIDGGFLVGGGWWGRSISIDGGRGVSGV